MANTNRWKADDHRPRRMTTKAGVAVEIGDLLWQDTSDGNTVKPAGSYTWDTDLATTQGTFNALFAGVAVQAFLSTQTARQIVIATGGVFEFDCAALGSALKAGSFIGPAKQSGSLLEPQKVASVANATLAIGKLAEDAPVGATLLRVEIFSGVFRMTTQANV